MSIRKGEHIIAGVGLSPTIVDDLKSNDSTVALSAKQGKVLNEKIEACATDARSKSEPITENDLSMELVEKINSGGGGGSGEGTGSGTNTGGGSGLSLSDIFNDTVVSSNKGWTSNKINTELKTIKDGYVEKDDGKVLSDNNFSDYYRKKLDSIEENATYNDYLSDLLNIPISIFKQDSAHRTVSEAQIATFLDKYTKVEVDNKIAGISTGLSWKDPVTTYSALLSTYPKPANGDTVNVTNDPDVTKNGTYTYNSDDKKWIQINSSTIPLATTTADGLMSKDDKVALGIAKNFVDNYTPPEVTTETIENLSKEVSDTYRKKEILIEESDIDPQLIKKLSSSDGSLIDDIAIETGSVWSSARTSGAIEDALTEALTNEVTASEVSGWFAEVDESFAWDKWA